MVTLLVTLVRTQTDRRRVKESFAPTIDGLTTWRFGGRNSLLKRHDLWDSYSRFAMSLAKCANFSKGDLLDYSFSSWSPISLRYMRMICYQ